jgi:hypothetical protein
MYMLSDSSQPSAFLDASHKAIISEWFVDVATNVSFVDLHTTTKKVIWSGSILSSDAISEPLLIIQDYQQWF